MTTEGNKDVVRHWVEELNKGNLAVVDEVFANTLMHHDPSNPKVRTREQYRQWLSSLYAAFPDARWSIDQLSAQGDRVVAHLTLRGTQQGDWRGIPARGQPLSLPLTLTCRLAGSKLVEDWVESDSMAMLLQLSASSVSEARS